MKLPKKSKLIELPWDSIRDHRKSWVLKKGSEQVRFSRCSMENGYFNIQKNKERLLTLQSFQARDTYRKLIDQGYKLGR